MSAAAVDRPAILLLAPSALGLAKQLAAALPGAETYGYAPRVPDADITFERPRRCSCAALFATGAADRRHLRRRHPDPQPGAASSTTSAQEPPVVAVAEDGSAVVPLLGGHHGANDLARAIARDRSASRRDHHRRRSALRRRARRAAARLARRQSGGRERPSWPRCWRASRCAIEAATRLDGSRRTALPGARPCAQESRAQLAIRVTDRADRRSRERAGAASGDARGRHRLRARRAGRRGDRALVRDCLAAAELAPRVRRRRRLDRAQGGRARGPCGRRGIRRAGTLLRCRAARCGDATGSRTRPMWCSAETGCYGVAEGAALAAVGPEGRLLVPKRIAGRVTCAIAESPRDHRSGARSAPRAAGSRSSASARATRRAARPAPRRRSRATDASSATGSISISWHRSSPARSGMTFRWARRRRAARKALDLAAEGRQRGAGLLRRRRHLRHGQPGLRADRDRRRCRLGAPRDHRAARRLGDAGGGRARRRAARP